LFKVIENGAVR